MISHESIDSVLHNPVSPVGEYANKRPTHYLSVHIKQMCDSSNVKPSIVVVSHHEKIRVSLQNMLDNLSISRCTCFLS